MNLTPISQDDDVYRIEALDYCIIDIANRQPQELLNKLTYVNDNKVTAISAKSSSLYIVLEGLDDAYDDIEQDIEQVEASSDVVDIVGTYADLQQYDTSVLFDNDVIKVISDETHDNACTFYRWNLSSFVYESYERNDIPVVLTSTVSVNPNYDVTYIVSGNNVSVTILNGTYTIGSHITIIAMNQCSIIYNGITKILYAHDVLTLFYIGNNTWSSVSPEVLNKLYPIGTIIWTNTEQVTLGGTWEKLPEGVLLVPDTENIGTIDGSDTQTFTPAAITSPSHVITLNETPSHTHRMTGTSGGITANHVHSVANVDKPSYNAIFSGSASADTTGSRNTSGIWQNHQHYIYGSSNGISGGTGTPAGHTHSITFNAMTLNVQQSSYAYYAWKRTA